ncbi:hypothetical protein JCM16814_27030 [Desulfobaculum senezii]|jgi:DnaK suppressor protein
MTAKDRFTIRVFLQQLLRDLERENVDVRTASCPDDNEYASLLSHVHTNLSLGRIRDARLREIRAALHRMSDPEFGLCEECGEPIGLARMKAYPAATLCVHCQSATEARTARRMPSAAFVAAPA